MFLLSKISKQLQCFFFNTLWLFFFNIIIGNQRHENVHRLPKNEGRKTSCSSGTWCSKKKQSVNGTYDRPSITRYMERSLVIIINVKNTKKKYFFYFNIIRRTTELKLLFLIRVIFTKCLWTRMVPRKLFCFFNDFFVFEITVLHL